MKAWIHKYSVPLTLVPVLAVMVMIFCFSAQPGDESGALSGGIVAWLVGLFVPELDSLPPGEQAEVLRTWGFWVRKTAHFSEYALLGFTLLLHILQIGKKTTVKAPGLWAWSVGTVYALSDEFHQYFVPGRGPALKDVCIDSAGVAAGVGVLWLILQIYTCNSRKRKL